MKKWNNDINWVDAYFVYEAQQDTINRLLGALRYYEGLIRTNCDDKILKIKVLDKALSYKSEDSPDGTVSFN